MRTLLAVLISTFMIGLARSTVTISGVVLGSYGDESLVDSIAVFGTYDKPSLPDGKIDFSCSAIETVPEERLPEAPEQIPCKLVDRARNFIPKSALVDIFNPSIALSINSSSLEIDDNRLLSDPLDLSLRYQEYSPGHHYADEFEVTLQPESFRWLLHKSLALIEPVTVESIY